MKTPCAQKARKSTYIFKIRNYFSQKTAFFIKKNPQSARNRE